MDQRTEVMQQIPGVESRGGGKSWRVESLWIDLLGEVEYLAERDFVKFVTPNGRVVVISAEDALVERVYAARKWTGYREREDECAKKLMTAVLCDGVPFDWEEAYRIASNARYSCSLELQAVRSEVEAELASREK